jgi:hypothetical protein
MGQDDDVEGMTGSRRAMQPPDRILQLRDPDQLRRGKRADGDDEVRLEQAELPIEMRSAIGDLDRLRHAVAAAARILSGKTADHGTDVHARAKLLLAHPETFVEPAEQTAACRVRERTAVLHFVRAGCLTDEHDARAGDSSGHRLTEHVRAQAACLEDFNVLFEVHALP